uniref:VOC domain-containing protein n=1 Tax=Cucumis sativus TaxID=3659 RepID=A0A0A0LWV9_CUCSA
MASLLSLSTPPSPINLRRKVNLPNFSSISTNSSFKKHGKIERVGGCGYHGSCFTTRAKGGIEQDVLEKDKEPIEIDVENGLQINEARPHDKLPYRGAWLWVGAEMIHLMELPNPDPLTGRPEHGGRDRHTCLGIRDVSKLKAILDKAGIPYTLSKSGRPAIFTRDPDANALEFTQVDG